MNGMVLRSTVVFVLVTLCPFGAIADDFSLDIREINLLEKRVGVYEKYNMLVPSVVEDLKRCTPVLEDENGRLKNVANSVVEYGNDLETLGLDDVDRATVQNEKYWKAILVLTANDDTVLFTRLLLLMREGLLRRAKIVLLFCFFDQRRDWERDNRIMQGVISDINDIETESNRFVEEGIQIWDAAVGLLGGTEEGERGRKKAIELYYRALETYPKNPWAWWEICQSHIINLTIGGRGLELIDNRKLESYYAIIRRVDPMYKLAFLAGKRTPDVVRAYQALTDTVGPCFGMLWGGEGTTETLKVLADGFYEMQEYEFALYAYKYLLFRTYQEGFNEQLVSRVTDCLASLNMEHVTVFLNEWLNQLDTIQRPESRE